MLWFIVSTATVGLIVVVGTLLVIGSTFESMLDKFSNKF